MAINPNILLQGNADLTGGINALFGGVNNLQNRDVIRQNKLFQKQQTQGKIEENEFKSIYNAARSIKPRLEAGDVTGVKNALEQRRETYRKLGLNTVQTDEGLEALEADPTGRELLRQIDMIIQVGDQQFGVADKGKLFQPFLGIDPETNEPALFQASNDPSRELRKLDVKPAKDTPAEASDREIETFRTKEGIKTGSAADTVVSTSKAKRAQQTIEAGLDAAKGIPVLRRTLGLLDSVKTGGFNKVALSVKQTLGIEGADEGELSANMGQAILGDLRATFGAQFTEKEGARLERIRANFGKNAETNKRLINQTLQIAEDAAKRAMKQAADQGDFRTAQEIQDALNFEFKQETPTSRFIIEEIN